LCFREWHRQLLGGRAAELGIDLQLIDLRCACILDGCAVLVTGLHVRPGDPLTVERFEGYVAGFELCNAFTELNDPLDQEQRFLEMGRDYAAEDEEKHPMDEDYLRAMRYGMPPCGGFGMGVDRLAMLLTDKHSIREVLLFPHLRSEEQTVKDE